MCVDGECVVAACGLLFKTRHGRQFGRYHVLKATDDGLIVKATRNCHVAEVAVHVEEMFAVLKSCVNSEVGERVCVLRLLHA